MPFAVYSLISLCRGIGIFPGFAGCVAMSWLPPCVICQPASCNFFIKSRRFILFPFFSQFENKIIRNITCVNEKIKKMYFCEKKEINGKTRGWGIHMSLRTPKAWDPGDPATGSLGGNPCFSFFLDRHGISSLAKTGRVDASAKASRRRGNNPHIPFKRRQNAVGVRCR